MTKTSPAQPRTCQDPPTKNLKQMTNPITFTPKKKTAGPRPLNKSKVISYSVSVIPEG